MYTVACEYGYAILQKKKYSRMMNLFALNLEC